MVAADPGAAGTAAVGGTLRRQGPWQAARQTARKCTFLHLCSSESLNGARELFFPN